MRHPTDGTLRRLLDEPEGVADAERDHVASCPVCLSGLATAREDADLAAAALAVEVPADSDTAWRRLSRAVADESPAQAPTPSRAPRTRARLAAPPPRAPAAAAGAPPRGGGGGGGAPPPPRPPTTGWRSSAPSRWHRSRSPRPTWSTCPT